MGLRSGLGLKSPRRRWFELWGRLMTSEMKIAGRARLARSPRLLLSTTRSARLRMPGLRWRKAPRGPRERPQRPLSVVKHGLLPNCAVEQIGSLRAPRVFPAAAASPAQCSPEPLCSAKPLEDIKLDMRSALESEILRVLNSGDEARIGDLKASHTTIAVARQHTDCLRR